MKGMLESPDLGPDFGPRNSGLWAKISAQKHTNVVCLWAEISGNLGPESSISGSKVQAQGPAILKCLNEGYIYP